MRMLKGLAKEIVYEFVYEINDEEAATHRNFRELRVHLLAYLSNSIRTYTYIYEYRNSYQIAFSYS